MKQPNTLTLAAASRGFNWNSTGPYTIDCNEAANADWPSSGYLIVKSYVDFQKVLDSFLIYTALANTAPGATARFTIQGLIPFTGGGNPPSKDSTQAVTVPASGSFNVDTTTKLTAGNWPTAAGTLLTVQDGATAWTFIASAFSAAGGAGGKSRWTVTTLFGPAPGSIASGAILVPSAETNSRIILATQGPISYDPALNYFN